MAPSSMRILGCFPGHLSVGGRRRVGGVQIFARAVLPGKCDQGGHCRGECNQCRDSWLQGIVTYRTYFHKWAFDASSALAEFRCAMARL